MSELPNAGHMLEMAEQAALADDLVLADELLTGVARIQEAELGPLHPDLANTLNNLAIVAEKTGRVGDAETFYRRAVAITSASLPADHPMVAASRENLEDFCRARGVPIATPASIPGPPETPAEIRADDAPLSVEAPPRPPDSTSRPPDSPPRPSDLPPTLPRERAPAPSEPLSPAPRRAPRSIMWAAIGVVVVILTATFVVNRPGSSPEPSRPVPAAPAALPPPQAAEPAAPPRIESRARSAPIEPSRPPTAVAAGILVTAQLCRTFSTSGPRQCDQVADPVSPGPIVLYTRVKSSRDAVVVHRWYRGDALRQSVTLTIRANATEGYRTYSRQTVDAGADWRVEVRSATGDLLHEQRFAVR
jgi:hypothetical protein